MIAEPQTPVMLVQASAHYSVTRTAGILGIGANQVIKIPVDERASINDAADSNKLQTNVNRAVHR